MGATGAVHGCRRCGARVPRVKRGDRVREVRLVRYARGVVLLVALLPATSRAQTAVNVEVDPVTCWWRTGVTSVRMGEPFSLLLTCSALETEAARAIVDRARLGSAAVQFPPYEVLGGAETPDHVTAGRRFMQYEYSLRLISEDAFGTDVAIPELPILYRIESRVREDAAVQGREQTYVLPPIPLRVTSLVPDNARHIRESSVPTLAEIASREFRARMLRLVALILLSIAGLTLAVALVGWARQRRGASRDPDRHLLPHRAVLAGVRHELRTLQQQTRGDGWTPETVMRALSATRVVASYLAGHAVSQRAVGQNATDGELAIRGGWLVRRRVAVSGTTTPQGLHAARASAVGDLATIEMDTALSSLTRARYGRDATLSGSGLDEALATAVHVTDRVSARHTWLAETLRSLQQWARGLRPRAWAR